MNKKEKVDYAVNCMLNELGMLSFDYSVEGVFGTNGNNEKVREIKRLVEELMETMPKVKDLKEIYNAK